MDSEELSNKTYEFVLKNQDIILKLLKKIGVENPKEKLKPILDIELYEILEINENSVIRKIRKKSTNEIFTFSGWFYHKPDKVWISHIWFEGMLTGLYCNDIYYKNYIKGEGGYYHLNDISLSDN